MQLIPEFNGPTSASHGNCYLCRVPRREGESGVVSTGISIDMEGMLEICQACVVEMAAMFGCLTPERAETLLKANRRLGQKAQIADKRAVASEEVTRLIHELQAAATEDAE